jgi:hypothetical protein
VSDAELGMIWWNRLREIERAHWLARADSAVPVDAWAAFKACPPRDGGEEVKRH